MLKINKKNFFEAYRFILVGLFTVTIDFIFYYIFIFFDIFEPNNAKRMSFILGAIFAFFANRSYVFRVSTKKITQPIFFSILYLTSFILNSLVHDYLYLLTNITLFSFFIATCVSTVANYSGQKFIIYKNKIDINENE